MKLVDLSPRWVGHGGEGYTNSNGDSIGRTERVGVICACPCGRCGTELFVPFENPIGPGPLTQQWGWKRTGETFETLTLTPSVHRQEIGGCGWHGFITNGEVRTV